ncbi:MAG: DUF6020 family protein [Bifidobacteriaceae bacterium]|jgi:hypothetical protein|nr:DUF6020 family protein [Bifidobacteriaceae bacterium]
MPQTPLIAAQRLGAGRRLAGTWAVAATLGMATAYAVVVFDHPKTVSLDNASWPALVGSALLATAIAGGTALWYRRAALTSKFVLTAGVLAALFTVWTITGLSLKHHDTACHWSNCAVSSAADFTPAALIGFLAVYYAAVLAVIRATDRLGGSASAANRALGGDGASRGWLANPIGRLAARVRARERGLDQASGVSGDAPSRPASGAKEPARSRRRGTGPLLGLLRGLADLARRRPFATAAVGIVAAWLPYYVIFFPGTYAFDGFRQLNEFLGHLDRTTHHPYMATTLMGGLFSAGKVFGVNGALFVYGLVQGALACGVFALTCSTVFRLAAATWGRDRRGTLVAYALTWGFFALVPVFPIGATVVYKDYPYTLSVLVLVNVLVRTAARRSLDASKLVLFVVGAFGAASFRNDGIVVVLASALCMVVLLRRRRPRVVVAAGLVVAGLMAANALVFPALGVTKYSNAEILSVPLQQTARYLKVHGDEVTPAQSAVLQSLLRDGRSVEDLPQKYRPTLSDPVKNRFKSFTSESLRRYLEVWSDMFARHPLTYVEATAANTYGYFWPTGKSSAPPIQYPDLIHLQAGYWEDTKAELSEPAAGLDPHYPAALASARAATISAAKGMVTAPVLWLLFVPGFYTWVLLTAAALLVRRRQWRALLPFPPVALVFLVCLASPVNSNLRYAFPYVVTAPLLVVYTLYALAEPGRLERMAGHWRPGGTVSRSGSRSGSAIHVDRQRGSSVSAPQRVGAE